MTNWHMKRKADDPIRYTNNSTKLKCMIANSASKE